VSPAVIYYLTDGSGSRPHLPPRILVVDAHAVEYQQRPDDVARTV